MLRRNQHGSVDVVLYGLAGISILAFGFFLILALTRSDEPVITSNTIEKQEAESRSRSVQVPQEWHTYTNPESQYTFSYPMEWGAVEQTSTGGKQPDYEYRFTSNEGTVVAQRNSSSDEPVHSQTFLVYNSFTTNDTNVTFCGTDACIKSVALSTGEVRLFTNQAVHDAAELTIVDGTDLRLIHLVNNGYGDWPGVVVSSVLASDVNTGLPKDEIIDDAVTNNYVRNEQLRQFADFIQ